MQKYRKLILSTLAGLALVFAAIGAAPRPALAQTTPVQGGPQILVTPYLWLAGINTAIKTPRPEVPTVDSSVGAFQLLGHLNGVPFMGSAEVRDGPFSLLGDVLHVPVGTDITTRNIFFQARQRGADDNILAPRCSFTTRSISRSRNWTSAAAFAPGNFRPG